MYSWYRIGNLIMRSKIQPRIGNVSETHEIPIIFITIDSIIKTSNGSDSISDDWVLYNQNIPTILRELSEQGWQIVIIDNGILECAEEIVDFLKFDGIYILTSEPSHIFPQSNEVMSLLSKICICSEDKSFLVGTDGDEDELDYRARGSGKSRAYAETFRVEYKTPHTLYGKPTTPKMPKEQKLEVVITIGQYGTSINSFSRFLSDGVGYTLIGVGDGNRDKILINSLKCSKSVVVSGNNPKNEDRDWIKSLSLPEEVIVRIVWFTGTGKEFSDSLLLDYSEEKREEYSNNFEAPCSTSFFFLEIVD